MKHVAFYDWNLNQKHPLSWHISIHSKNSPLSLPDVHSALHFIIVQEGEYTAQYNKTILTFTAGEIFVTAPWEIHASIKPGRRKLLVLNIDPVSLQIFFFYGYENLERLFMLPPAMRKQCLNNSCDLTAERKNITKLFDLPDSDSKALQLWHALLGLFIKIKIEEYPDRKEMNVLRRLQPALQKLSGKSLSIEEAANACSLSSSYFSALFRQTFGLSFAKYERFFRLNGAADDILRGMTLKEAADVWGFCDKSHLARLLKAHRSRKKFDFG